MTMPLSTGSSSRRDSLAHQSAWAAGAAILMSASRILVMSIIARKLRADVFGQFAYAQWLVDISILTCSLGATGAVSRYLAEFRADPGRSAAFLRRWTIAALVMPCLSGVAAVIG